MINGRTLTGAVLGFIWLSMSLLAACKGKETLPGLGDAVSGPIDVVSSPSGKLFYVLNSDYQRRYDEGSLLVIDPAGPEGNYKRAALSTRRMGRSLHVAQNLLLVTYDDPEKLNEGFAELWSLSDESQPKQLQTWDVTCSPINAIIAPSQPYFAVTCNTGAIYLGTWENGDPSNASLDLVRTYGFERRALYFYEGTAKTWLLGFPSDSGEPQYADQSFEDRLGFVPNDLNEDQFVQQPNVIPDIYENSTSARRRATQGLPYQMFAYNVTEEAAESARLKAEGDSSFQRFRLVELGSTYSKPTLANQELNYIHFILRDANGQPNTQDGTADIYKRNYRTNFYEAKRGPENQAGVFYLSQRGNNPGSSGNNVLRLTINPSALARIPQEEVPFDEIFAIDRIYGLEQDIDTTGRFPSDFEFATIDGEPMLLINHFRDLINFQDATFYSVTRKFLNQARSLERPSSADSTAYEASYFQIAVSDTGKVLTGSFYGDSLFLFDAHPRISMNDQNPIRIQ